MPLYLLLLLCYFFAFADPVAGLDLSEDGAAAAPRQSELAGPPRPALAPAQVPAADFGAAGASRHPLSSAAVEYLVLTCTATSPHVFTPVPMQLGLG